MDLEVTPLAGNRSFGAEVDLDLSRPLSPSGQEELVRLLYRHGLLLFRGQSLDDDAQTRVMALFGNVLVEEGGHREISADGNLGKGRLLFHSDLAFTEHPFRLLSLYALDVTEGTTTQFASTVGAAEALEPELRAQLEKLHATAVIPPSQGERLVGQSIPASAPRQTRPCLVDHPVTGQPMLFMSEQQTARIEGVPAAESNRLLDAVFSVLYDPANVLTHSWRNGDLVIWDNLALQHGRPDQSGTPRRRLRRIAVAEKTFFELCPQFPPDDPRIAAWGTGGLLELD